MKLAKLPDRTTTKITFNAPIKLNDDLKIYASLYRDTYGEDSSVPELIPHILEAFLKSDPAFTKAQKKVEDIEEQATKASLFRTGKSAAAANTPSTSQTKGA
jgi:hypothetical protein